MYRVPKDKEVLKMKVEFNKKGAERKELIKAISEILNTKPKYLGMPTAAYDFGGLIVDKNGALNFEENVFPKDIENLLLKLQSKGFYAEDNDLPKEPVKEPLIVDKNGALNFEENVFPKDIENLLLKLQSKGFYAEDNDLPKEPVKEPQREGVGLTVAIPLEQVQVEKLSAIINSKANLIKKALGISDLPIIVDLEKVSFPWFKESPDDTRIQTYTRFIAALCKMSITQKRVQAKEKEVDNEKYAFRCFLLRLGFIGSEFKEDRKILLKNLEGSSAFRDAKKGGDESCFYQAEIL